MIPSKASKMAGAISMLVCVSAAQPAFARDLVYQPISPAFGGSPLNSSFVLGLASANNRFTEDPKARAERRAAQSRLDAQQNANDPAARFSQQITASLLSQIAANVSQQIIGENARDSGVFSFGGTQVQFSRVNGQISIDITESATGGRTNIQIPAPQF